MDAKIATARRAPAATDRLKPRQASLPRFAASASAQPAGRA